MSCFVGGSNQGLPVGPWSHIVSGSLNRSDLFNWAFPLNLSYKPLVNITSSPHTPSFWQELAFKKRLHIGEHLYIASAHTKATYRSSPPPQVSCHHHIPVVVCQNNRLLIHRFSGATRTLCWYIRTTGSQEGAFIKSIGRFLTTSESLPPISFSTSPCWLILSVSKGMPEVLAPY
jgi:hypothetical protein